MQQHADCNSATPEVQYPLPAVDIGDGFYNGFFVERKILYTEDGPVWASRILRRMRREDFVRCTCGAAVCTVTIGTFSYRCDIVPGGSLIANLAITHSCDPNMR